jgi:photosystem II stability/assembly factor-like uncharacterized protein
MHGNANGGFAMLSTLPRLMKLIAIGSLACALAACSRGGGGVDNDGGDDGGTTAFWTHLSGPTGGTIRALVADADGRVFAGALSGGVFRSTNSGASWTQQKVGLGAVSVLALAIDSKGVIFAGTAYDGIFRSTDRAATWENKYSFANNTAVDCLAVSDSDFVFAGTSRSVYRSKDGGETWVQASSGLPADQPAVAALAIGPGGAIFAGMETEGVFMSPDNGDTWIPRSSGISDLYIYALAYRPASGSLFAGTRSALLRSIDGGASWQPLTDGLPAGAVSVVRLAVDPSGNVFAGVYSSTSIDLYVSSNNGDLWSQVSAWPAEYPPLAMAFFPGGKVLAGAFDDGIYTAPNAGAEWTLVNSGLTARGIVCLAANASGHVFAGTGTGAYRTKDGGTTWQKVFSDGAVTSIVLGSNGKVFLGCINGNGEGVNVSASNGDAGSWVHTNWNTTLNNLAIDSGDTLFVAADGVFRSDDGGQTWTPINVNLPSGGVNKVIVDSKGVLYAAETRTLYRSMNNGNSWEQCFDGQCVFVTMTAAPNDYILASLNGCEILITKNHGSSWTETPAGIGEFVSFAVTPDWIAFAGMLKSGAYMSTDTCASYTNSGLSWVSTFCMTVTPDGRVWAGTDGGVYKTTKPVTR